jgi:broad specificity phosphatase PhoE
MPAARWQLSEEGRARCIPLADCLRHYVLAHIVSSGEGKAVETAEIVASQLGLSIEVSEGLSEHDRTGVPYHPNKDEFQREIARFFSNPEKLIMGRETAVEARERFANALESALARYKEGNVAVVAHGTVISLFVAHCAGLQPYDYWKKLDMPSFAVLSIPDLSLLGTVDRIR